MKKYIVIFLMILSNLSFAQVSISWPINRSVFQRSWNNQATVWIAGQSFASGVHTLRFRIFPLSRTGVDGTPSSWADITMTNKIYRFSITSTTGWYRLEVQAYNTFGTIGTTATIKFGVGEVFLIAGQSNAQGGSVIASPPTLSDDYDCIIVASQSTQNKCSNNVPVFPVFGKLDNSTSEISPSGYTAHCYRKLATDFINTMYTDSSKIVPVLFLNAGAAGTSIDNWRTTAFNLTSTSSSSVMSNNWCFSDPNAGVGEPYRTFRNALNFYGSMFGMRGIIWHQGETDGNDNTSDTTYARKLKEVIDKSRSNFNNGLNWAISRVSRYYNSGDIERPNVRRGQRKAKTDKSTGWGSENSDNIVDTAPTVSKRSNDRVHFITNGYIDLAGQYHTSLINSKDSVSILRKQPILANTLPYVDAIPDGSGGATISAQTGFYCYQWVSGDGNYTSMSYPPNLSCTGTRVTSYGSSPASYRCYMHDGTGNIRMTQRVYFPVSNGNTRIKANEAIEIIETKVYPNPAEENDNLFIEFTLPEESNVRLELVDTNGKVLKVLADGSHAKGTFKYPFKASELKHTQKTIFYRLINEGYFQSKKIELVR